MKSLIFEAESIHALQRLLRGEPGGKTTRRIIKECFPMEKRWKTVLCDRCKGTGIIRIGVHPSAMGGRTATRPLLRSPWASTG